MFAICSVFNSVNQGCFAFFWCVVGVFLPYVGYLKVIYCQKVRFVVSFCQSKQQQEFKKKKLSELKGKFCLQKLDNSLVADGNGSKMHTPASFAKPTMQIGKKKVAETTVKTEPH